MPDTTAEQNAESQLERKEAVPVPQAEPQPGRRSAVDHSGAVAPLRAMLASAAGQEPPPQQFAPLFFSPEYSHPANDAQRARLAGEMQQQFGNRYLQRMLSGDGESESGAARSIQGSEASGNGAGLTVPSLSGSAGQPLDAAAQDFMGSRFGQDFGGVRVHTDSQAQQATQDLNADAFTTGRDIYFNRGAYDPSSQGGQKLLAHELAHVAQNEQGTLASQSGVSRPGDPLEREAEAASEAVMRGEMFPPLSSGGPVFQRQEAAPAAGGETPPAAEGGATPAAAAPADFSVTFAGTTFHLPLKTLLRRAAPDSQISVPSSLLRRVPAPPGFGLSNASVNLDQNKAPVGGTLGVSLAIPPVSGTGSLTLDKKGSATGSVDATISSKKIPGLTDTTVKANVGKDQFDLDMTVGFDLPKVTGSLNYKYKDKKHSGEGKAHYEGAKLKGDIDIKLSEAAKLSGSGTLDMELFKGLVGKAEVEVDEKRNIKVKGELRVAKQIELFPEKKYEKSFFNFDKKFPLWGITIPVIDVNVGLFAEIHASAGFRAKFGPGVLRDIALSGEFGTDPEAATQLGLTGEFFLPAGAEVVLTVGGGIGLGLAIADITGGIDAVGVAGIYAALSIRPTFQYAGGKYSLKGTAELAGVAQLKLGINAFAKIDVGVWLFKGTVWRKDWNLAEWIWNTGLNVALRANMSYTLGEDFVPDFSFEADKVDPKKLIGDVMPESGSPVPAPPKAPEPSKSGFTAEGAAGEQKPGAPEAAPTPTPGSPPAKSTPGSPGAVPPKGPGGEPKEPVQKSLNMAGAGHTLKAVVQGGQLIISMSSPGPGRLRDMIDAVQAELAGKPKTQIIRDFEVQLAGIEQSASEASIMQDWRASGARDPRGTGAAMQWPQFMEIRLAQLANLLTALARMHSVQSIEDILKKTPERRYLPGGYDVRAKLYERGSGWSSTRDQVATDGKKAIKNRVKLAKQNNDHAEWTRLKTEEKIPEAADIKTFTEASVDSVAYHVDHIRPLSMHWQIDGGNNNGDDSRWNITVQPSNLRLITAEANLRRPSGSYVPYVGLSFTSQYAEGGVQGATGIDGQPFTDAAGTPIA